MHHPPPIQGFFGDKVKTGFFIQTGQSDGEYRSMTNLPAALAGGGCWFGARVGCDYRGCCLPFVRADNHGIDVRCLSNIPRAPHGARDHIMHLTQGGQTEHIHPAG